MFLLKMRNYEQINIQFYLIIKGYTAETKKAKIYFISIFVLKSNDVFGRVFLLDNTFRPSYFTGRFSNSLFCRLK